MRWTPKWLTQLEWHRWYAWRPVRIQDQMVWREWVERRRIWIGWGIESRPAWEYRPLSAAAHVEMAREALNALKKGR